jgi:hypothetical protein
VVDHLVDVDVALSLIAADEAEVFDRWPSWSEAGRPLRWLRQNRLEILATDQHHPTSLDPRSRPMPASICCTPWRLHLVDQAVRRVSTGVRDWGPVLSGSRSGKKDLIELGRVRSELLKLEEVLTEQETMVPTSGLQEVQQRCRELAWKFERTGGAARARAELVRPGLVIA